jgi:hypothetical protein
MVAMQLSFLTEEGNMIIPHRLNKLYPSTFKALFDLKVELLKKNKYPPQIAEKLTTFYDAFQKQLDNKGD